MEFLSFLEKDANKQLEESLAIMTKINSEMGKIGEKRKGISTPSGSDSANKKLIADYQKMEATIVKMQLAIDKLTAKEATHTNTINKKVQAILNQAKSYQSLEAQKNKAIAQTEKEIVAQEKSANAYEKVKAKIASMLPVFQNYATKQELGIKLTAKEERQLAMLEGRLIKYRGTLNEVNKKYGNYSLEVGNYAKGNTNLANSIGQISRELPNFGQSFSIGVLSLTNNIGAVIDSIKQVREQNEILKKQGLATKSVLSQITTALFSWQTALFIGIGILSAYSKEIGDFFEKMVIGSKSINSATKSLIEFQKAQAKGNANASNEIQIYNEYVKIAGDKSVGYQKQKIAIDYLRNTYGGYLKNLSDEQIMKLKGSKIDKEISASLYYKEKYNANLTEIQQIAEKIQIYKQERDARLKYNEDIKKAEYARYNTTGAKETLEAIKYIKYLKRQEELRKEAITDEELKGARIGDIMLQITSYEEMYNAALKQSVITKEKSLMLENKDSSKTKKERIRLNYEEAKSLSDLLIARLEEQRAIQKDLMDNQDATDFGRLEARKEYSRLSLEILEEQHKQENLMNELQRKEDLRKATETFNENKKNGFNDLQNATEYNKALADINDKYNNLYQTSEVKLSTETRELWIEDANFYNKIQKDKFDKAETERKGHFEREKSLNDDILKLQSKRFQEISNNEKYLLITRAKAFESYKQLALTELDNEKRRSLTGKETAKELELINEKYRLQKEAIEGLETPLQRAQEETRKYLDAFRQDQLKTLDDIGLSSAKIFLDFKQAIDEDGNVYWQSTFDKMIEGAKTLKEEFKVVFSAVSEVAQEAFNIINQAGQASTQAEIDRLKIQYDTAWEFSDKSDVAKRKLDAERERREKEIAQKEFKRKQNMAVVNIGIDTAQAIMATYGQAGWIGGTAGAIFLGAMGLAQIALVKSQKMPEYYTGTENAKEGFALTQERGREIIKDKHGKIKSLGSDKGAQVTWLDSGDKVLNNQRTMQELMFDKDLNNILANNNITMPKIEMHTPNIDFSPVVDAINNQPIIIPDFDKLKTRIKRGNTIQTIEKAHTNFSSVKI